MQLLKRSLTCSPKKLLRHFTLVLLHSFMCKVKLITRLTIGLVSGKLVCCKVIGIANRKPRADQLDTANPVRNEETGFWQCPFCQKNDFPELSDVNGRSLTFVYMWCLTSVMILGMEPF